MDSYSLRFIFLNVLIIFGIFGNILVASLCLKKRKRTVNFFICVIFLCVDNVLVLLSWDLMLIILSQNFFINNIMHCGYQLLRDVTQQCFSWFLVITLKI